MMRVIDTLEVLDLLFKIEDEGIEPSPIESKSIALPLC